MCVEFDRGIVVSKTVIYLSIKSDLSTLDVSTLLLSGLIVKRAFDVAMLELKRKSTTSVKSKLSIATS